MESSQRAAVWGSDALNYDSAARKCASVGNVFGARTETSYTANIVAD